MAEFIRKQGISKVLLTLLFSITLIIIVIFAIQILYGYWQSLFGSSGHKPSEYVSQAVTLVVVLVLLMIVGKGWSYLNQKYTGDKLMEAEMSQAQQQSRNNRQPLLVTEPALLPEEETSTSLRSLSAERLARSYSMEMMESWSLSERLSESLRVNLPLLSEYERQESQSESVSLSQQVAEESQLLFQQAILVSEQASLSLSEAAEYQREYQREQARISRYEYEQEQSQLWSANNSQKESQYFSESMYYSERERENQAYSTSLAQSQFTRDLERRHVSESFSLSYIARVESENIVSQQEREAVISDQLAVERLYQSQVESAAQVVQVTPTISTSSTVPVAPITSEISTKETDDFDALIKKINHLLADNI